MEDRVYDEYRRLRPKKAQSVAKFLARVGHRLDRELQASILKTKELLHHLPPLAAYCAEALVWTRHARNSNEFLATAGDYITGPNEVLLDAAEGFHGRFGPDRLRRTLQAMRDFCLVLRDGDLPDSPSTLKRYQDDCMERVATAKSTYSLSGVGPWLFLAPFKMHVTQDEKYWDSSETNQILMPLGIQVERALRMLHADGIITDALPPDDYGYSETPGDEAFLSAMGHVAEAQGVQKSLAELGGSYVPHINSGLYELGYRGD